MPIRFPCESCQVRIKVPDGAEGKKVKCPSCGHAQRVPGLPAAVGAKVAVGAGAASAGSETAAARGAAPAAKKVEPSSPAKSPVKRPVAATSATPPKTSDEADSRRPAVKPVAPATAPIQADVTNQATDVAPAPLAERPAEMSESKVSEPSLAADPISTPSADPHDALAALASAAGAEAKPADAPPIEDSPPQTDAPRERSVLKAVPLAAPPPPDVPIATTRRKSQAAGKTVTAKRSEGKNESASPVAEASTPGAESAAAAAPVVPLRAIPLGPPAEIPAGESSALAALRAAMADDERAAGAAASDSPSSDLKAEAPQSAAPVEPVAAGNSAMESLAAFLHGGDAHDQSKPDSAETQPENAAPPFDASPAAEPSEPSSSVHEEDRVFHADSQAAGLSKPVESSLASPPDSSPDAGAHAAARDSNASSVETSVPVNEAQAPSPDPLWSHLPLNLDEEPPIDPGEAADGNVRDILDDFARREERERQAEEQRAASAAAESKREKDFARELDSSPVPSNDTGPDDAADPPVTPAPVIVAKSVPRLVRTSAAPPARSAVSEARKLRHVPAPDDADSAPPPRAIPLARQAPQVEDEPTPEPALSLASTESIASHFAEPPSARARRSAPAPAYSLLLVLCWTLRILACLSLGSIAKLLLMWSDNGAKLTDILIAVPLGLGVAGGIWAIGEVARVARDAARNSHH